ncbi:MAG: tRNA pseudouridine(55) synthase TruB, partial [Tepidisphaeraceae bacterium]
MPDGMIILDKPAGATSAAAVAAVKRILPIGTKVGHAGTLDSFATGLLVLLVGRATRACEQVMSLPKTYEATIKLGANTETDDPLSPEQARDNPVAPPTMSHIESTLARFVGTVSQRPPRYSA